MSDLKMVKIFSKALMVGVSILVSLIIIEVFFYLKPDMLPAVIKTEYFLSDSTDSPPGTVLDSEVGYKYLPELSNLEVPYGDISFSISTSSLGYKDVGFRDDGLNGDPYAIVLGDSMVVCVGVDMETCWVEQLEQDTGRDFINMGVSGFGPDLQYQMLKKYGLPLKPQRIIWVFFPNDLIQAWRYEQFGQGGIKTGRFWENPVLSWLARYSTIYVTLSYFWYERNFFGNLYMGEPAVVNNTTLSWWLAYTDLTVPEVHRGLQRTRSIILDAQHEADTINAEFTVVILPFREQIVYRDSQFGKIFSAVNQAILAFGATNNISVVDLTQPMFEKTSQSPDDFFYSDSHLKPEGNRLVSEILAQELMKNETPPPLEN